MSWSTQTATRSSSISRLSSVEWEHAHMQVRLGSDWAITVGVGDLDEDRLALCMLAQRLFLVADPMRLLDDEQGHERRVGLRSAPRP
jgi:hypothetical protein